MYIKAWNVGKIVLPMVGKDILSHNFFSLLLHAYFSCIHLISTFNIYSKPYHPLQYKQHVHSHSFVLLWQTLYQIDKTPHKLFQAIDYPVSSNVKWHSTSVCFLVFFYLVYLFLIILATYCWYNFIKLSLLFLFKLFF